MQACSGPSPETQSTLRLKQQPHNRRLHWSRYCASLGRRLAALPLMILGITLLVFLVLQAAPGDQASSALGDGASEEAKEQYRQDNGLNDPLVLQYFRFLGKLLQLDLGVTTPPAKSVASMIGSAFPLTLQLTFLGRADRRRPVAGRSASSAPCTGTNGRTSWSASSPSPPWPRPSFWLGILLIQWFALGASPLFPSGRNRDAGIRLRRLAELHGAPGPRARHPGLRLADPGGPHLDGGGAGPRLRPHRHRQRRAPTARWCPRTCSATPWSPR